MPSLAVATTLKNVSPQPCCQRLLPARRCTEKGGASFIHQYMAGNVVNFSWVGGAT